MACATFIEKNYGSTMVSEEIYHSWWFILLWGITTITGIYSILKYKLFRKLPALLVHAAFILILGGALITHLTSLHGTIHLREGIPENYFVAQHKRLWNNSEINTPHRLPYSITLQKFKIITYPGTQAPADYVSTVLLTQKESSSSSVQTISMNRILSCEGYRFYQMSFDPDHQGSWLSINYDPYGIPVTYTGYALLTLSMLLLLLEPGGTFRKLLRHPALKRGTITTCLLLACFLSTTATTINFTDQALKKVIPEKQASELGKLQVLYNDRITPLHTLARDFSLKLTGTSHYKGLQPEQLFSGWIFFPEVWQYEPLIPIKNKELATLLQSSNPAPLTAFFTPQRDYRLPNYWSQSLQNNNSSPLQKAITETDEKVQLILMLEEGKLLKVFPIRTNGKVHWYSPTDSLPNTISAEKARFIHGFFTLLYESILQEDYTTTSTLLKKLSTFQYREGGETILSPTKLKAELFYNRFEPTTWLYRICLSIGTFGFLFLIWNPFSPKTSIQLEKIMSILLLFAFLSLTITVVLRSYIAGRPPLGNGYETMISLAWALQLLALLLRKKIPLAVTFGFLLSGFTLLVSTLGQMNPQITPLMPVLLSPWLSLHVSLIMAAYALYAFTFLCAITALLFTGQRRTQEIERLTVLSQLLLYPATFLLGIGIFVGAVWANVSWGTYWSWDPKEVWALISFLIYAFPLHMKSLPCFQRPIVYHLYITLAFFTLLMTYFGVNYFLGGMHSYAE